AVPHGAAGRPLAARAVLPQRKCRDAGRRGEDLQLEEIARPERRPGGRPRRIPEVAVNGVPHHRATFNYWRIDMSFLTLGNATNILEARRAFLGNSGLL